MKSETIQTKLTALKDSITQLDQKIIDPKTKEYFMRPVWNSLGDVERFLLPNVLKASNASTADMWADLAEFQLANAARGIEKTAEVIGRYGTSLQLIG